MNWTMDHRIREIQVEPMETLTEVPTETAVTHTDMEMTPTMIPTEVRLCLGKTSLRIRKNKL